MFKNSYKLLFVMTLMLGTLITVSSNSWLSAWMGLEINLLSFIPLMNDTKNLMSSESSLKYFLIQALASSILLFLMIYYLINMNHDFITSTNINLGMMSSLMLKSGMAPFHFWFPNVIEGLNWINSFILLTWQKIAPLMLMSYLMTNYLFIPIILSMIVGSLGGLNQTSLRKIMAYSSINHLGWMGAAMIYSDNLWLNYFLFYSFLSITLIYFFNINKLFFMNQMYSMFNYSNEMKLILFLNFLSLGGLPPFLGFFPKWMVIQMMSSNQLFLITIMVMLTLITLYYYIRMCYAGFMMNYYENKWNSLNIMKLNNMTIYLILSFISIFGLMIINLLFFIF
uniref:NADH-ubiquinone oxidoreductase chain 2 n=1 Tax=Megaselia scalaris TaxID=36166 RepID=W8EIH6_MEGSC|nr:NADH dehydrogenase subunit 2 [Megaselia scalaris]AHJ91457.1 NADH dehydrogenase subunit 2 [Megaselia scalaris]